MDFSGNNTGVWVAISLQESVGLIKQTFSHNCLHLVSSSEIFLPQGYSVWNKLLSLVQESLVHFTQFFILILAYSSSNSKTDCCYPVESNDEEQKAILPTCVETKLF